MGSRKVSLSLFPTIFLYVFAAINVLIFVLGVAGIAVGSWLLVKSNDYEFLTDGEIGGPIIILISGLFTCIVTGIGFFGACLRRKYVLVFYGIILLIIIILQLVSGILGFVYRDTARNSFEEQYSDRLTKAIMEYNTDKSAMKTMDNLQKEGKCCGNFDPSDWGDNGIVIVDRNGELPESCQCDSDDTNICNITAPFEYSYINGSDDSIVNATYDSSNTVYIRGCFNETAKVFERLAVVYGGVGIGFGIFEIIVMLIAFGLAFVIHKSSKEYEVV